MIFLFRVQRDGSFEGAKGRFFCTLNFCKYLQTIEK